MASALILYGSKARGDVRAGSDTDLILATDDESQGKPLEHNGVSVRRTSKDWLENEARAGSLFAYHIGHEGFAFDDPDNFLIRLRHAFQRKDSYKADAHIAALILRMLLEHDWGSNTEARDRFFWAARTVLICTVADNGALVFSSAGLEREAGLPGIAAWIDGRATASFDECVMPGHQLLERLAPDLDPSLNNERLRKYLSAQGGISRDSVRMVQEHEATVSKQVNRP